jgi:superfamily II DNA or RNA helicase
MSTPILRKWQELAIVDLEKAWLQGSSARPLIAACPGSGKTLFACHAMRRQFTLGSVEQGLIVVPTVNIKGQWGKQVGQFGFKVHYDADNESLRWRRDRGQEVEYHVIAITYAQLLKDPELFSEWMLRNRKTLLIADEVHHTTEEEYRQFGAALNKCAEVAERTLALSGTPFRSNGEPICMCESVEDYDDDGRKVRRVLPTYNYSYSEAIRDEACRPVEFVKVMGKADVIYRSMATGETWEKCVDLANKNKTDRLGVLLDPDGEFMEACCLSALKCLAELRKADRRAAMLVVAKDKDHGDRLGKLLKRMALNSPALPSMKIEQIYNDTPGAHAAIERLDRDDTDIVITVRMVSEGVDVKRFRVGLYATPYLTEMFFRQFVGRFVRWQSSLGKAQSARVIIPGHIALLGFAKSIELMVDAAYIAEDGGDGQPPGEEKNEILNVKTTGKEASVIYRGREEMDLQLGELFFQKHPVLRAHLPMALAIAAAREAQAGSGDLFPVMEFDEAWSSKNDGLVNRIVARMRQNGDGDDELYRKVNNRANRAVGISRKDRMTPVDILRKRHEFLRRWFIAICKNEPFTEHEK